MTILNDADALFVGGTAVDKVYRGSTQVWPVSGGGGGGDAYVVEVLADVPMVYWRLGESSGTTAADAGYLGVAGTYVNSPTLGTTGLLSGDTDTAVTFNGTDQGVQAATNPSTLDANPLTVEAIIKPSRVTGTQVIASRHGSGGFAAWTLRLEGTDLKFIYWYTTFDAQTITATTTFAAGTEYHVVARHDGSRVCLFVNGVKETDVAATFTIDTGSDPLRVAYSSFGEYFQGVIDEVALYAASLSDTRIADHYAATGGTPPTQLTTTTTGMTASSEINSGEGKEKILDGSSATKWLATASTAWVEFDLAGTPAGPVTSYRITSANDAPGRDPKDWTLQGWDGSAWVTVDTETGQTFSARFQTRLYTVDSPGTYTRFRWNITANNGDSSMTQVAELSLWTS